SQQDALLPHVENGTIVLIGATTENPYFEVNTPLLSRSRVFRLEPLSIREIRQLLELALADKERGLGNLTIEVEPAALDLLSEMADGDARLALNALEVAAQSANPDAQGRLWVSTELAAEAAQARILSYDKSGDEHYDTISAFIKSVRGSDPDAAVYWLAKMLISGEDPRFIARRLVILASEDIGNADPLGLVMANAAAQAAMFIGLPEAELTLAQATTYLAGAPKSNSSTIAISRAKAELSEHGALPVPPYLRDAHYRAAKRLGHGEGYRYPHDYPGNFVPQKYLPDKVQGLPFYEPSENGAEAEIKQRLALWRERMRAGEKADESE
ncbi:MAG: replication-associated recombination protein A, partial [Armatimonadetes bacterium]|nr:replication-associated recombination protein A [Armatimonadota bacterium]